MENYTSPLIKLGKYTLDVEQIVSVTDPNIFCGHGITPFCAFNIKFNCKNGLADEDLEIRIMEELVVDKDYFLSTVPSMDIHNAKDIIGVRLILSDDTFENVPVYDYHGYRLSIDKFDGAKLKLLPAYARINEKYMYLMYRWESFKKFVHGK